MDEKIPPSRELRFFGVFFVIVSIILVLVWSYYSSEWWSPVIAVIAAFFFIEGILHMNVYAIYPPAQ